MNNKKRKSKKKSNNSQDFFGMGKSPSYLGGKSNINFLNSKQKPLKRSKQKKVKPLFGLNSKRKNNSKPTNFLSRGKVMPKQKHINWNYKQIKKRFPGINPYGDADMDGSMNYKDCKPFDASKDGNLMDILKGVIGKKDNEFQVETKKQKTLREVGVKFKAIRKKQRRESLAQTGEGVRRLTRKVLYKRTPITKKGKIVGYKTVLRGDKPVSTKVLKAVALAGIPVKVPKGKDSKEGKTYASAGRPKGPSGKYQIPGKGAVYEHEYKKWLTKQRALARIQAEQARGVPTEDISEEPQRFEENDVLKEYGPEEVEEPQEPTPQQITPEQIQRIRQIQQMRQAQQAQQSQQAQQPSLSSQQRPSQTVGSRVPDNILNAPNVARGELRTSQSGQEIQSTNLGEKPQVNPQGQYYTDIDPISGKPIMLRRVSEKFVTGEAL